MIMECPPTSMALQSLPQNAKPDQIQKESGSEPRGDNEQVKQPLLSPAVTGSHTTQEAPSNKAKRDEEQIGPSSLVVAGPHFAQKGQSSGPRGDSEQVEQSPWSLDVALPMYTCFMTLVAAVLGLALTVPHVRQQKSFEEWTAARDYKEWYHDGLVRMPTWEIEAQRIIIPTPLSEHHSIDQKPLSSAVPSPSYNLSEELEINCTQQIVPPSKIPFKRERRLAVVPSPSYNLPEELEMNCTQQIVSPSKIPFKRERRLAKQKPRSRRRPRPFGLDPPAMWFLLLAVGFSVCVICFL